MYYGGIWDSDKCFCLRNCLLTLSIWQTRCVMYNMPDFGQINNFLVLVLVLELYIAVRGLFRSLDPSLWKCLQLR